MLIDSHCHLDFPDLRDELDGVVERARQAGISRMVTISTRVRRQDDLLCIAETDPDDWAEVGDVPVRVRAVRTDGTVVVEGVITIYVSEKPAR